jgi:hypothetical protein
MRSDKVIAMPITRRQLLKRCLTAGLFSWLLPARASQQESVQSKAATLTAWLDTLIPADETPSASQLGVDRDLLEKGRADDDYQRVLDLGVAWLEQQARELGGKDFVLLDDSARATIVTHAAAAGTDTLEGIFFEITRADAFLFYYARPEGWHGLPGYHGPPQPLGYMEHHQQPGN